MRLCFPWVLTCALMLSPYLRASCSPGLWGIIRLGNSYELAWLFITVAGAQLAPVPLKSCKLGPVIFVSCGFSSRNHHFEPGIHALHAVSSACKVCFLGQDRWLTGRQKDLSVLGALRATVPEELTVFTSGFSALNLEKTGTLFTWVLNWELNLAGPCSA